MGVFDGFDPLSDSRRITSLIPADADGCLLSEYLGRRFTYRSTEAWLDEISSGRLLLNAERIFEDKVINVKDQLVYEFEVKEEPECDLSYKLLGADENFICVAKSGNLPTHPAGRFYKNTLWYLLQRDFGACAPVNRLDRETSGVILFARNAKAAKFFSTASMCRKYNVIVHGKFPEFVDADGFIFKDTASLIRKKRKFSTVALADVPYEKCRTVFSALQYKNGLSLLEATLYTGRTHQIRSSCFSLGFPVAGDKMYGVDENIFLRYIEGKLTKSDADALIYDRQALHCCFLSFKDMNDKEWSFEADFDLKIR